MQKIVIITGTPGVGKTVLSRMLSRQLGSLYLNLGDFVKKNELYTRYDRRSQSYIIHERRLHTSLNEFFKAQKRESILVETHWLGRFMPRRPGMVAVVVRLDPVILAKRLFSRNWQKHKIWENVESELIDLSFYEALKFLGSRRIYQIDATRTTTERLVKKAMELLHSGIGWDGFTPDWLAKYDPVDLYREIL